jgi:hypothetical protein
MSPVARVFNPCEWRVPSMRFPSQQLGRDDLEIEIKIASLLLAS